MDFNGLLRCWFCVRSGVCVCVFFCVLTPERSSRVNCFRRSGRSGESLSQQQQQTNAQTNTHTHTHAHTLTRTHSHIMRQTLRALARIHAEGIVHRYTHTPLFCSHAHAHAHTSTHTLTHTSTHTHTLMSCVICTVGTSRRPTYWYLPHHYNTFSNSPLAFTHTLTHTRARTNS